jgi:hypothetical protein
LHSRRRDGLGLVCIDQLRDGAGRDVPLAMFGTPKDPDYWRAAEIWVSASWHYCCPPGRSTSRFVCSTNSPHWSINEPLIPSLWRITIVPGSVVPGSAVTVGRASPDPAADEIAGAEADLGELELLEPGFEQPPGPVETVEVADVVRVQRAHVRR